MAIEIFVAFDKQEKKQKRKKKLFAENREKKINEQIEKFKFEIDSLDQQILSDCNEYMICCTNSHTQKSIGRLFQIQFR